MVASSETIVTHRTIAPTTMKEAPKGKKKDEFGVKFFNEDYNIYSFLNNHPGGTNYVKPYEEKDVTERMKQTNHSSTAYYLLREYRKKGRDTGTKYEDDDLESLVDWSKPIWPQVGNLGMRYNEWVFSPVDREMRMFENSFMESMTITKWYVIPLVWIPVVIGLIYYGTIKYMRITQDNYPVIPVALTIVGGVLFWSALEYFLHRYLFHISPSGKNKAMIYFHFAIHGVHHKAPFDSTRLVFPPLPAAVIMYIIYTFTSFFVPDTLNILLIAGGILGYIFYDMMHFYLHYGSPDESSYLYFLKRYHNQHHFTHQNSAFGISSVFWDKLFGTEISLRKLGMGIKW